MAADYVVDRRLQKFRLNGPLDQERALRPVRQAVISLL